MKYTVINAQGNEVGTGNNKDALQNEIDRTMANHFILPTVEFLSIHASKTKTDEQERSLAMLDTLEAEQTYYDSIGA